MKASSSDYQAVRIVARLLSAALVVPPTFYFTLHVTAGYLPRPDHYWIAVLAALILAGGAGVYVWRNAMRTQHWALANALLGALVYGGIAFTVGFVGAETFLPGTHQGPLLGFVLGFFGFVGGAVSGIVKWLLRGPQVMA